MDGFRVDTEIVSRAGKETLAAGQKLSDYIDSRTALDSATPSMIGFHAQSALRNAAHRWAERVEKLAALVCADGDRMMQTAKNYQRAEEETTRGFRKLAADLSLGSLGIKAVDDLTTWHGVDR